MEAFPRFLGYFQLVFTIHPYIYVAPILIRFPGQPMFCFVALYYICAIFSTTSSFGRLALPMAASIAYHHTWNWWKLGSLVPSGIAFSSIIAPVMHHMWLARNGGGNANFLFFQCCGKLYQLDVVHSYIRCCAQPYQVSCAFKMGQVGSSRRDVWALWSWWSL